VVTQTWELTIPISCKVLFVENKKLDNSRHCVNTTAHIYFESHYVNECMYVYVYVFMLDGDRMFTVDFGSSLSEAVLKFYPAVARLSNVSPACLTYSVHLSSSAVELVVAVSDMSEDGIDVTMTELRSDMNASRHQQVGTGRHSAEFLRGRQYVVFTAKKIKASRTPDRAAIQSIQEADGSCKSDATRK